MRRRAVLLLTTMTVTLLLASGVALAAVINCKNNAKCVGTQKSDRLLGTAGHNWMLSRGGNDILRGYGAYDWLQGGSGNDRLFGGDGFDVLYGGPGDDTLDGGNDHDDFRFKSANWGHDIIVDEASFEYAYENSVDFYSLSANLTIDLNADPVLPEVTNADTASTVDWSDEAIGWVNAGQGNDTIRGIRGSNQLNYINGYGGDDWIDVQDGGGGADVDCGEGNDTVFYDTGDTIDANCEVRNP